MGLSTLATLPSPSFLSLAHIISPSSSLIWSPTKFQDSTQLHYNKSGRSKLRLNGWQDYLPYLISCLNRAHDRHLTAWLCLIFGRMSLTFTALGLSHAAMWKVLPEPLPQQTYTSSPSPFSHVEAFFSISPPSPPSYKSEPPSSECDSSLGFQYAVLAADRLSVTFRHLAKKTTLTNTR